MPHRPKIAAECPHPAAVSRYISCNASLALAVILLQLLLQPRLQLLHALVVPGKILFLYILGRLIAEMSVYGGVDQIVLLVIGEPIPKLPDAAGVDKGPLELPGRQNLKIRMHTASSLLPNK